MHGSSHLVISFPGISSASLSLQMGKGAGKDASICLCFFPFAFSQYLRKTGIEKAGKSKLKTKKRFRKFFRNLDLIYRTGGRVAPSFPFLSPSRPGEPPPGAGLKGEDTEQEITISPPASFLTGLLSSGKSRRKKAKTLLSGPGQNGQSNH